jgi:hypothetical protein
MRRDANEKSNHDQETNLTTVIGAASLFALSAQAEAKLPAVAAERSNVLFS